MENLYTLQECFEMEGSVFPFEVLMHFKDKKIPILFVEYENGPSASFIPKDVQYNNHHGDTIEYCLKTKHHNPGYASQRWYIPIKSYKFNKDMENLLL